MSRSLIRKNQLHPDIADLVGQYGSGFFASDAQVVYISGNQTISGIKTFASRPTVNGTGVLLSGEAAQADLSSTAVRTTGDQTISGVKTFANSGIFNNGIDLNNSKLINAVPDFNNFNANFSISGNQNNRILIANSASQITGTIAANNPTGFNTTVIQVGNGKILITGSVNILSYFDQYRTAGRGAAISILHTGNNGYVMYGNTSL